MCFNYFDNLMIPNSNNRKECKICNLHEPATNNCSVHEHNIEPVTQHVTVITVIKHSHCGRDRSREQHIRLFKYTITYERQSLDVLLRTKN